MSNERGGVMIENTDRCMIDPHKPFKNLIINRHGELEAVDTDLDESVGLVGVCLCGNHSHIILGEMVDDRSSTWSRGGHYKTGGMI